MTDNSLGGVLTELFATIEARRGGDPKESYTASLLFKGSAACAKKFGEEAVEAAIAGAAGDRKGLTHEAADVLYHLMVLLASADVAPGDVAAALKQRRVMSGHEEKASRD